MEIIAQYKKVQANITLLPLRLCLCMVHKVSGTIIGVISLIKSFLNVFRCLFNQILSLIFAFSVLRIVYPVIKPFIIVILCGVGVLFRILFGIIFGFLNMSVIRALRLCILVYGPKWLLWERLARYYQKVTTPILSVFASIKLSYRFLCSIISRSLFRGLLPQWGYKLSRSTITILLVVTV